MLGTGKGSAPETSEERCWCTWENPTCPSPCALALSVTFTIHIPRLRLQSFRQTQCLVASRTWLGAQAEDPSV